MNDDIRMEVAICKQEMFKKGQSNCPFYYDNLTQLVFCNNLTQLAVRLFKLIVLPQAGISLPTTEAHLSILNQNRPILLTTNEDVFLVNLCDDHHLETQ